MRQLLSWKILEIVRLKNMITEQLLLNILFCTFYCEVIPEYYIVLSMNLLNNVLGVLACSGPWCGCVFTCFHAHVLDVLASLRVRARLGCMCALGAYMSTYLSYLMYSKILRADVLTCLVSWFVLFAVYFKC